MPSSVSPTIHTPLLMPSSPGEQSQAPARANRPLGQAHSLNHSRTTSMGKELRRSASALPPRTDLTASAPSAGAPGAAGRHHPADAFDLIGKAGSFSGTVEMKQGRLTSRQPVIDALLQHASAELAGVRLEGPASLSLTLDPGARWKYEVLQKYCAVEKVDVLADERATLPAQDKEPINGNVLIPLLQAVIILKSILILGINLGVDILYAYVDPRIRLA